MDEPSAHRAFWIRTVSIQVVIVAGLVIWFKVCMPRMERRKTATEASERERKIEALFANLVIEDARNVEGPDGETLHPQRLRSTPSASEVEQELGAPRISNPDFRGGQHLTWIGTTHRLEAAFDKGRMYSLRHRRFEDRARYRGVRIERVLAGFLG